MPSTPESRPVVTRPDANAVAVGVVSAGSAEHQRAVADAITAHWRSVDWPEGLVALNCFTGTRNDAVLTFEQWATEDALRASLTDPLGISLSHPGRDADPEAEAPTAYRIHQVVRGTAVDSASVSAQSFPVAAFPMENEAAARQWITDLLKSEEAAAGANRAYPGAIAANIHIGLDGKSVLIFSEWRSEAEAVAHMEILTKAMLADVGNSEEDLGALYRHHSTLARATT
ncbi:hypothetical protein [Streptomyces sp. NPDC059906]|uniref:hypothetical protein n=1 Tax=Streptomyces sp. NPDC059906 TaxID=3346997 RepID=UPI00364F267B